MKTFDVISPIDQSIFARMPYSSELEALELLERASTQQGHWQVVPLEERQALCTAFVDAMMSMQEDIALAICQQMGRPLAQAMSEVQGLKERADYMISIAQEALSDEYLPDKNKSTRIMRKQARGVVLVIAPWNYPLLTAVNVIVPALLAGNAVILKHSSQTPVCANFFAKAFEAAGLMPEVFNAMHLSHEVTQKLMQQTAIQYVSFTGSVDAGRHIQHQLSNRFIDWTLELGGKDAAYVRKDADLSQTVPALVDGAFFNAGQSCCGIERIYVDKACYAEFIDYFVSLTHELKLGNPLKPGVTLGPMARESFRHSLRHKMSQAVAEGAKALIDESRFDMTQYPCYCAPQVLVDVDNKMPFMQEELFGPAVGIMPVESDEHALACINDSAYGLTGSVWTRDIAKAQALGDRAQVGTWFMNRCDYLDPALAWSGVKDTGKGISLSRFGFDSVTKLKSYHLVEK